MHRLEGVDHGPRLVLLVDLHLPLAGYQGPGVCYVAGRHVGVFDVVVHYFVDLVNSGLINYYLRMESASDWSDVSHWCDSSWMLPWLRNS